MNPHRLPMRLRLLRLAAALALLPVVLHGAQAQTPATAPASPGIKLVVPFAAGTPVDIVARAIGTGLAAASAQPVVIENRAGAAGNTGTEQVVSAAPDGRTLLVTVNSTVTINPLLYERLKYDPRRDLVPLAQLTMAGYVLVANPKLGVRDIAGLVAAAKASPTALAYASYGAGSMPHVCTEALRASLGIRLSHVPYRSGSLADIIAGQADLGFEPVGPALPAVQQQTLIALGMAGERIDALPAVPSIAESVPGYQCPAWIGVLAPKDTPKDAQRQLSEQLVRLASTPAFAAQMKAIGLRPRPLAQEAFIQAVRRDADHWALEIKRLGVRLE